jgi:CRISPR-associated protein Cmr4
MSKPQGIPIMTTEYLHAYRYFAQALDPIHIGTGGERLSRVDLAIVREAGTDLPKLPGTSLSGACRAYAALQQKGEGRYCAGAKGEAYTKNAEGKEEKIKEHCGKPMCPICQTFGYARGDGGGKKGAAQFTDAHIIAFPVASTNGPLWVTSPGALARIDDNAIAPKDAIAMQGTKPEQTLAIGWLALQDKEAFSPTPNLQKGLLAAGITSIALVSDALFTAIVKDNLEVRTSVAIDPGTGAAEDGALFTYEAIPTGTLFAWEVMYQGENRETAKNTVESGFTLFAWLGVGGMNTRGMGRLRVLDLLENGGQGK